VTEDGDFSKELALAEETLWNKPISNYWLDKDVLEDNKDTSFTK